VGNRALHQFLQPPAPKHRLRNGNQSTDAGMSRT
jgi:hypothetical protein